MFDLSGPSREALYLTAFNTGYRASQLGRLIIANLHLDDEHPHVSFSASNTKNRDEARIPLRDPNAVQFLKDRAAGKPRDAQL